MVEVSWTILVAVIIFLVGSGAVLISGHIRELRDAGKLLQQQRDEAEAKLEADGQFWGLFCARLLDNEGTLITEDFLQSTMGSVAKELGRPTVDMRDAILDGSEHKPVVSNVKTFDHPLSPEEIAANYADATEE